MADKEVLATGGFSNLVARIKEWASSIFLPKEDYLAGMTWDYLEAHFTWDDLDGTSTSGDDTYTPNLNLVKAGRLSTVGVNRNMDILDEAVSPRALFNYATDGAWAAGSAKSLGASRQFALYCVFSEGGATPMLGVTIAKSGGGYFLRCSGGYVADASGQTTYMCSFTIEDDGTWSLIQCGYLGHTPSGGHGVFHAANVGRVIRLL